MFQAAVSQSFEGQPSPEVDGTSQTASPAEVETQDACPVSALSTVPAVKLLIDGEFVPSAAQDTIKVLNPVRLKLRRGSQ